MDLDGDNRDDMVVWRPSDGTWYALLSGRTSPEFPDGFARDLSLQRRWGQEGDLPLPGIDFNGDGREDLVVWRPTDGTWYALLSDATAPDGLGFTAFLQRQWGQDGDVPLF